MIRTSYSATRRVEKALFGALGVVVGVGSLALVAGAFERTDAAGHASLREQVLVAQSDRRLDAGASRVVLSLQSRIPTGPARA
jgi:hypothetical protein